MLTNKISKMVASTLRKLQPVNMIHGMGMIGMFFEIEYPSD